VPKNIWQNTQTGLTTSTWVVTSFQIISPSTVTVWQPFDITIRPKDINWFTVTNYTGSFIFDSSNFWDIIPSPGRAIAFSGTNGEMTFPLGITMKSLWTNHIYVYDVANNTITWQVSVQVQSPVLPSVNDVDFSKLWWLDNQWQSVNGTIWSQDADINYPEAMNYASWRLGTWVVVAVLDTGIAYDHPDLTWHMWNGQNCLSDTGAYIGWCIYWYDFANNDSDPYDDSIWITHWTHVAGTIGAITNNGIGTTGVAQNVQLMALKVFDKYGSTDTATIIRAINFAKYNNAKVINASFWWPMVTTSVSDFDFLSYNAISNFPWLFIASAGNEASNNNTNHVYPAWFGSDISVSGEAIVNQVLTLSWTVTIPGLKNVIVVAASDQFDNLAYFSNYGTGTVHIAAPGTNIYSTMITTASSWYLDPVSYTNGWFPQVGMTGSYWTTRTPQTVSGEGAHPDLSNALWWDTQNPITPNASMYIQKWFSGVTAGNYQLQMHVWCDSPSTDYIDVLISTGGLFQSIKNSMDSVHIFILMRLDQLGLMDIRVTIEM